MNKNKKFMEHTGHSATISNSWIHFACLESLRVVHGFSTGHDWAFHVWWLCHWRDAMTLDSFFPDLRQRWCSSNRMFNITTLLEFLHSKFQHCIMSSRFPTPISVLILLATMQSRIKCVITSSGLSEGESFQQCSPKSDWIKGEERRGSWTVVHRSQKECSAICTEIYITSLSGLSVPRAMSTIKQPIYEILILICYFDIDFILKKKIHFNQLKLSGWNWLKYSMHNVSNFFISSNGIW